VLAHVMTAIFAILTGFLFLSHFAKKVQGGPNKPDCFCNQITLNIFIHHLVETVSSKKHQIN